MSAISAKARHRILVAKPGLDGHDRGAKVLIRAFQQAGYEVIYTGLRQSPAQIAIAAVQEDVDLIGLSILSGAHLALTLAVLEELKRLKASDIPLVVGGTILKSDADRLIAIGVAAVFPTGSTIASCIEGVARILGNAAAVRT
jgi:methylmalonyl-CoA mutase C-terminal domain/subunit